MIRPSIRLVPLSLALVLAACSGGAGGGGGSQAPAPSGTAAGGATPATNLPWPVKTREHVDLWLHGFAMVQDDTTRVPYFKRGYRDRMLVRRNQARVTTLLDTNRDRLRARLAANPELVNAQFLILQAESWDEMRQVADLFLRAEGDPQRASSQQVAGAIATLAQYFPKPADREWLQLFMQSLNDEQTKFYHAYWTDEQRTRAPILAAVDSLWQQVYRPKLQGFLNANQLASGDLLVSMPLDGEGRTQQGGKTRNIVTVTFPDSLAGARETIYAFAHEAVLPTVQTAVGDNVTPNDRRAGLADRYTASGVVVGGWLLLRKQAPELADGYARYYLLESGRAVPARDPGAALEAAFPLPAAIRDAIVRQIDLSVGGI